MPTAAELAAGAGDEVKADNTMKGPFVFNAAVLNVHFHCDASDDDEWLLLINMNVFVIAHFVVVLTYSCPQLINVLLK